MQLVQGNLGTPQTRHERRIFPASPAAGPSSLLHILVAPSQPVTPTFLLPSVRPQTST